jgi:hypothetical protein
MGAAMARELIGHIECPECGGAAEVKRQKNGLAYRWCMDCHAQYFPRTSEASERLIAKTGAKPPTVTAPATAPAPAPAPDKGKPIGKPKANADVQTAPAPTPAPATKTPAPATPRNGLSDALAILGVK